MKQQRRKRHYISLIAFFILALLFSSFSTGISAQEPAVKIWPFPEDLPEQYKSSDFSISAEGLEVPVYASGLNAWGNTVSYASFESTREITVCVTVHFPLETAVILPRSLEKAVQMQGDKVFLRLHPARISRCCRMGTTMDGHCICLCVPHWRMCRTANQPRCCIMHRVIMTCLLRRLYSLLRGKRYIWQAGLLYADAFW